MGDLALLPFVPVLVTASSLSFSQRSMGRNAKQASVTVGLICEPQVSQASKDVRISHS